MQSTERLVKTGEWSVRDELALERDGAREESEEVINRSRI